jgi:hypothetical protein
VPVLVTRRFGAWMCTSLFKTSIESYGSLPAAGAAS